MTQAMASGDTHDGFPSPCTQSATQLLEKKGLDAATVAADYSCGLGEVDVTVMDSEGTVQNFSTEIPAGSNDEVSSRAALCTGAPNTRTIVSELQVDIFLCVTYGQVNSPTNGSWSRSIDVDWTVYPGWNSAQSRVVTAPSAGAPTLTGTITSQKQNGIFPPTELSSAAFSMNGNDAATGYVVGGLNTGGSHAVKMEDREVTDSAYSFNKFIGAGETTPRFSCDTSEQRCFYPNGEEAGL